MAAGSVAAVYAGALLALADERGARARAVDDCRELAQTFAGDRSWLAGLDDPRVGKERAKSVLAAALAGKVSQEVVDLTRLLVDRNRLRDLPSIVTEAVRQAERAAGVVRIVATTATALDEAARGRLLSGLKRVYGPGAELAVLVDPTLIGGLTLRVGDTLVDGSVRRQLADIKSIILAAPVKPDIWDGQPQGISA